MPRTFLADEHRATLGYFFADRLQGREAYRSLLNQIDTDNGQGAGHNDRRLNHFKQEQTVTTLNQSTRKLNIQLAGRWFDDAECGQLAAAPWLWSDTAGQKWLQIGDEPAQRIRQVERLTALPIVALVTGDEVFLVAVDDYIRQV
jgi:hypothetical protein